MIVIVVVLVWLIIGAAVGLIEARRGYWHRGWVVSAFLGPLAIPYAIQDRSRAEATKPVTLEAGERAPVGLSVLVGVDGSEPSRQAALTAINVLAGHLGRVALAVVLDYDTAASPEPEPMDPQADWPERTQAKAALAALADELEAAIGLRPETVLLAGDPPTALEAYAVEDGHDFLVVGTRGHGLSEALFGSCASRLGRQHDGVPALLVPTPLTGSDPDPESAGRD